MQQNVYLQGDVSTSCPDIQTLTSLYLEPRDLTEDLTNFRESEQQPVKLKTAYKVLLDGFSNGQRWPIDQQGATRWIAVQLPLLDPRKALWLTTDPILSYIPDVQCEFYEAEYRIQDLVSETSHIICVSKVRLIRHVPLEELNILVRQTRTLVTGRWLARDCDVQVGGNANVICSASRFTVQDQAKVWARRGSTGKWTSGSGFFDPGSVVEVQNGARVIDMGSSIIKSED